MSQKSIQLVHPGSVQTISYSLCLLLHWASNISILRDVDPKSVQIIYSLCLLLHEVSKKSSLYFCYSMACPNNLLPIIFYLQKYWNKTYIYQQRATELHIAFSVNHFISNSPFSPALLFESICGLSRVLAILKVEGNLQQ